MARTTIAGPLRRRLEKPSVLQCLGPGLITGAADDDPSGIATYSQTGAQFGFQTLWTLWLTFPLMVAMQFVSALIGRVTGKGLAANLRDHYPRPLLYALIVLLFIANTINLGADIGAIGAAMKLLIGGPATLYAIVAGVLALALMILLPFRRYTQLLKVLTLCLFAYAGALFFVHVPWLEVAKSLVMPKIEWTDDYITAIVAIFGTTISPYLFFWQASHEVEEQQDHPIEEPLHKAPEQSAVQLRKMKIDTTVGMLFSNVIAFCIMLTAGAVLHAHGITKIESAAQAAEALRPIAGRFSFILFAGGIVGTGLLAIPTLAGSTAYAIAETFRWRKGLNRPFVEAMGFYGIVALGTLLGIALNLTSIDPMKALYWSAVVNGLVAVPLMALVMRMASRKKIMGRFVASKRLRIGGWAATAVMAAAAIVLVASWMV
jgi:NRAMP (natural resistance-associated macrophage protein)-like metal ion transporter